MKGFDVTKAESQKFLTGFSIGENRARVLKITLNNGRNPIHFDGTETISMFVTKPSDTSPSIGLCSLEDDTIIYNVLQSDVSEEGTVKFSLKVEQLEDDLITVLYAAHFGIQVTDPECDDSHAPDDPNFSILEQLIAEVEEFDSDAEAYAVGTRGGEPVEEGDPAYHNNAKYYAENLEVEVEEQVERAEAWATGTKGGVPVSESDPQYHNNAKYYAEQADTSADNAATSESNAATSETNASGYASAAAASEANALSYKNAASGSATDANTSALAAAASEANALSYKNAASGSATDASNSASAAATSESNALGYKNAASQSATDASGSATSASGSANAASSSANTASQKALDSEAWSKGTRGGVPVAPGDPTYENNAKYWAEQASAGQIQSDWDQDDNTQKDYIKNKPTIPDEQIQSDWDQADNTQKDFIKNKPTILKPQIKFYGENGDTVSVTNGIDTFTGTISGGSWTTDVTGYGSWDISVNGDFVDTVLVDCVKIYEASFGVEVTLTLNGAKNDVITIKNSNNVTVGTCTFETGQTSSTVQIEVPVGGRNFKFVSSVAKDTTTGTSDYEKTVFLSDAPSQTVNVYPKKALYWYGNLVDFSTSSNVITNNPSSDITLTFNTNNFTLSGTTSGKAYIIQKLINLSDYSYLKMKVNASTSYVNISLCGNNTYANWSDYISGISQNISDSDVNLIYGAALVNPASSYLAFYANPTAGSSVYEAIWLDDGHEDSVTIHGAKEDTITIKDSDDQTVATCIFESGKTVGYVSKALLTSGTYKFISSVAKDTATGTSDYEKTITLDGSESEVNVYHSGALYWYGNYVKTMVPSSNVHSSAGVDTRITPTVTDLTNSFNVQITTGSTSNGGSLQFTEAINFANVNVVKVNGSCTRSGSAYSQPWIVNTLSNGSTRLTSVVNMDGTGIFTLDTTSITTNNYFVIGVRGTASGPLNATVNAIWQE